MSIGHNNTPYKERWYNNYKSLVKTIGAKR
jgi:hypothetical protein